MNRRKFFSLFTEWLNPFLVRFAVASIALGYAVAIAADGRRTTALVVLIISWACFVFFDLATLPNERKPPRSRRKGPPFGRSAL